MTSEAQDQPGASCGPVEDVEALVREKRRPLYALARKCVCQTISGKRTKHFLYATYASFLPLPPGWAWCE